MPRCGQLCKCLVALIAIISSAVASFFIYLNVVEMDESQVYTFMSWAGVTASILYVLTCVLLIWGSQNDQPNCMIPWLVLTWIGVICYANCLAQVIDATASILVSMLISIINWAVVMQVFLNMKNWRRQDNRDTVNNENIANFQSTSAS